MKSRRKIKDLNWIVVSYGDILRTECKTKWGMFIVETVKNRKPTSSWISKDKTHWIYKADVNLLLFPELSPPEAILLLKDNARKENIV